MMEEPLHKDQFEDFLKKSFENYRESPSDALWDKIEGDLQGGSLQTSTKLTSWLPGIAAILVVVMLSIITWQYLTHHKQVLSLKKELIEKEKSIHQMQTDAAQRNMVIRTLQSKVQHIENNLPEIPAPDDPDALSADHKKEHNTSVTKRIWTGSTSQTTSDMPVLTADIPKTEMPDSMNTIVKSPAVIETQHSASSGMNANELLPVSPSRRLAVLPMMTEALLPAIPPYKLIKTVNQPGRWTVGGQLTAMKTWARVKDFEPEPDPHPEHQAFTDTSVASGLTLLSGISVGFRASPHLALETGLNYRSSSMSASHQPQLRFRDGHHHGGPGGPGGQGGEYDFSYQLNTAYGAIDIDLRAEQVDSAQQIDEDEPIGLTIRTKNIRESVSIPLMLAYRMGDKRLHLELKGGIIANILLQERFRIEDIQFNDAHFKAPQDKSHSGVPVHQNCLSLDYIAGLGLSYDISRNISVHLTPVVSGSLIDQVSKNIKISDISAGMNTGLSYRF